MSHSGVLILCIVFVQSALVFAGATLLPTGQRRAFLLRALGSVGRGMAPR